MRNFPRVSRSAPTDRIPAVRDVTTRPRTLRMPAVAARRPPLDAVQAGLHGAALVAVTPRFTTRPPEWDDPLTAPERTAADLLHAHLLDVVRLKRTTDEDLAGALERAGCWPLVPPGPPAPRGHEQAVQASWRWELRRALALVLVEARAWWAALPEPQPCAYCGARDLCDEHKEENYAVMDGLNPFARRIVHDVPREAAEGMRGE